MRQVFLMILIAFGISLQAHPVFYVRVRPPRPALVVERPVCPGPRYIWVEGEWGWNPRIANYEMHPGHWIVPPPHGRWIPGHWKQTYRGYFWVPGHWRNY